MRCTYLGGSDQPFDCYAAGMTFQESLTRAVLGTATSNQEYFWLGGGTHPREMRIVASTRAQIDGETLPGWGPQFPNDNDDEGRGFIAVGYYSPFSIATSCTVDADCAYDLDGLPTGLVCQSNGTCG